MDPTSRFLSALALAAASLVPHGAGAANGTTELEMYKRCKSTGDIRDCEAFLNAFPSSSYAPDVAGDAAGKSGGGRGGFSPGGGVVIY